MKHSRFVLSIFSTTLAIAVLFGSSAFAQSTSSSIRVVVTNESGSAAADVPVDILHVPTGRLQTTISNDSGIATLRGLPVGGPYEVSVSDGSSFTGTSVNGLSIGLDETAVVSLQVQAAALDEITVLGKQTVAEVAVGVGTSFNRAVIDATPSISRDFVSVLARDPKILVDNSVARGPAVSMAGQNFRFNSVTIDGIPQNDNFGLNKNASATSRTPISIDAVEAVNANIAPYDVSYGNFVGGNINIVTKSGTNEFHGSAFYYTTDESMSGDKSDGANINIENFDEETIGFTLGGPIIKDKLFFFVNYEKFETTLPANAQPITAISGVTQADVDNVIDVLQTEYGFDPGKFATSDTDEDEKRLIKFDWNINDDHRAVLSYQYAKTDVLFDDFPTSAALNSNRYNINQEMTATSVQVFSNWSDRLSTEVKIGTKEVIRRDRSVDGSVNEFLVRTAGGGVILAGGDRFRHINELDNDSSIFRIKADYAVGDHIITGGWERESKKVRNLFLPNSKGVFCFDSIADLENRILDVMNGFSGCSAFGGSNTGVATDAEANFTLDVDSFYAQDEWTPTDDLTVSFGVRYDTYTNDDPIKDNPNYLARRGFSNGENLDGKDLMQPRFGVNWDVNDRLTIRGGAGLFGGGAPLIILSNSYAGDGISRTFALPLAFMAGAEAAIAQTVLELPDPTAAFRNLQPFIGVDPAGATDAISPNYEILSTWKYSIGADYVFGDDWLISADIILSQVKDGYDIFEERRTVIGTAPDGRPIYDSPGFGFGWDLTTRNTDEGKGTVVTLGLAKTFDTSFGLFDMTLGYTHQDMDELRSYNRFVTFETHVFDANIDMNNPAVAPSRYEVENRVTATLSWQKELFGDNTTSVGVVYAGRSGRHYSYVFGSNGVCSFGGLGLADCGAETDIAGSQLFYVPTGASDPLVTGDAAFLTDLNAYIDTDSCLAGSRGSAVTRNNCETDWTNVMSVRLSQEIKVGGFGIDVMLDIENFGNLLNSDWGRVDSYTAPSVLAPANVAIAGGQYVLTPTSSYDAGIGAASIVSSPEIAALPSVYRIQLGIKFRF